MITVDVVHLWACSHLVLSQYPYQVNAIRNHDPQILSND